MLEPWRGWGREYLLMNGVNSSQFLDGCGVVVHAQVSIAVVETRITPTLANNQQSRGLPTALVAAGLLPCPQGRDEAFARSRSH